MISGRQAMAEVLRWQMAATALSLGRLSDAGRVFQLTTPWAMFFAFRRPHELVCSNELPINRNVAVSSSAHDSKRCRLCILFLQKTRFSIRNAAAGTSGELIAKCAFPRATRPHGVAYSSDSPSRSV